MSSTDLYLDSCEDESCRNKFQRTFYCVPCNCSFCETCWDKQPAHKRKWSRPVGQTHEKIDRLLVERYRDILEPVLTIQEQDALHKDDENATWFGISRNEADEPIFEDYGRYAALMTESLLNPPLKRYPRLVSFIGQTGKKDKYVMSFFC